MRRLSKCIPYIFFYAALALMMYCTQSCASKKTVEKTVDIERTSISYALPTSNILTVSQICDSITGKAVGFSTEIGTGTAKGKLSVEGGNLKLEIRTDTVYRDSIIFKDRTEIKAVTVVKKDWDWILAALALGFVVGLLRPWRWVI